MGQKINPLLFRVNNGFKKGWSSSWFEDSDVSYSENTIGDVKIYNYFKRNASKYSISKVFIERIASKAVKVVVLTSKVGVIIGKSGEVVTQIQKDIEKLIGSSVNIDIKEVKRPNIDSNIIARSISDKLEKRQSFKRAVKFAIENAMKSGALGVKIIVSGRLNGAEIARSESFKEGIVPLQTIRAGIDYAFHEALTIYGIIGVRVWVCNKR